MKKYWLILTWMLCLVLFFAVFSESRCTEEIRALSLKSLQKQLRNIPPSSYPEEILHLAGITRLQGYQVDDQNNDIILFGQVDPALPPLLLEDLVVALRNAWFKYAPLQGNTYVYSYPGCSIDPNPATIQKLNLIGQRILGAANFDQVESEIENWHTTCKEMQKVRVMGMPFHTHFARILVQADYDMKLLVDGTDSLDIPGFTSLVDRIRNRIRDQIITNAPVSMPPLGMQRFWFFPGENYYEENQGTFLIAQSPVSLLTERTYLSTGGQYVPGQENNPVAQEFTRDYTLLYQKIAQERPIYLELENMFRFVALAKMIKFKASDEQAGLDLNYLLEEFPLVDIIVDENLPGRSAVKEFYHRQDFADGYQESRLWLPSCGGVSIEMNVNASQFHNGYPQLLEKIKTAIHRSRPSNEATTWDFNAEMGGEQTEVSNRDRLFEINRGNEHVTLATVVDLKDGFRVYGGENGLIYEGNSMPDLVDAIHQRFGQRGKETVYLDTQDFASADKVEAFASSLKIQNQMKNYQTQVNTFPRQDNSTAMQDAFFSPGIRLEIEPNEISVSTEAPFAGRYQANYNFFTKVRGQMRRLTTRVHARTEQMAQAFRERIKSHFSARGNQSTDSVAGAVNQIRKEIQKQADDFIIQFIDEIGASVIGEVNPPREGNQG